MSKKDKNDKNDQITDAAEERPPKKPVFLRLLLTLIIIMMGGGAVAGYWFTSELKAPDPDDTAEREFVVESGWTSGQIARRLAETGLVKSADMFALYCKLTGHDGQLRSGEYLLSPSMSMAEIMARLIEGRVVLESLMVPEGYQLKQIEKVFVEEGICDPEAFWDAVANGRFEYNFLNGLNADDKRLEGYLFPDTYWIEKGMTAEEMMDMMLRRFEEIYDSMPENNTGLSENEIVILASIVENEIKLDEERPLAASVFLNRLRQGMRLESCATIQYHYDVKKPRLLYSDLEIDSPYNTYRNDGLPPGPISSPGAASIRAVFEAPETDYLFFVAKNDGSGGHVFTRSLSEHNRAQWELRNNVS
jgi:UPF0755 protein